jgi:transposase-like protein
MPESKTRRRLTADEKLRILEEAQQPGVQIAELCRRHGRGCRFSPPL